MRFFHLCFLAGSLVIPLAAAPNERPRDLETLITAAMTYNPAVRAAEHRFRRALAQYRGEKGFFDPQFAAATGVADEIRPVPGVPNGVTNPAEAVSAEAGIDKAFAPGFYAGVGATERRHWNAVDGRDVYQTLIGAQLRVPLWRDFAYREQTLAERQAWASCAAAYSQFIEVRQQIR
ncbi:MAG: TolC family protein, partial [Candidatus Pacebacteria bacterium]|nr:TolC family protein [Candidatus Paceibacterota bacterium]